MTFREPEPPEPLAPYDNDLCVMLRRGGRTYTRWWKLFETSQQTNYDSFRKEVIYAASKLAESIMENLEKDEKK